MLTVAPAAGFDSLVSLDDAGAYHASMGHAWTGSEAAKEAALRRATQYLLARYRVRSEYLDPVHPNIAAACCEAALRVSELYVDAPAQAVISETVGPISTTYSASRNGGQVRFPILDDLLAGLTDSASGQVRLIRA